MARPRLAAVSTPWLCAIGAALGAVGALAQAPSDVSVLILAPLAFGFVVLPVTKRRRGAFAVGWAVGLGYFSVALRWIVEPFQVDAAATGWMAPFALVLLAAGLALFWGGAFSLARPGGRAALLWTWPVAELARAYVLTGFPWANPAQAVLDTALAPALALVGPHGVTFLLMLVAAGLAVPYRAIRVAATLAAALLVVPYRPDAPTAGDHTVRIVQPNAPQDEKWHPERAPVFVQRQVNMTGAAGAPDLVVWPEMAIPYMASVAAPVFEAAATSARGAPVLIGARRDPKPGTVYNSALVIGPGGRVAGAYDKHHLVPFGEYMPFPALFRAIGIRALAERTAWGYARGVGPTLLDLPVGRAGMLICYEAVFPQHSRTGTRPDLLIQMTNDAWFGLGAGPRQHLAQARMRAIEQGLPLVRAANTGISAAIGPRGQVLARLELNTAGHVDAVLPLPLAPTLYARTGDLIWAVLLLAGVLALVMRGRLTFR